MIELKPCPFCGANALMRICDRFGGNVTNPNANMTEQRRKILSEYKVVCFRCGVETKNYKTLKGAFNAWNRRAEKTAEWFDKGSLSCRCSACGCKSNKETRFCPNCGAKMNGIEGGN